MRNAPRQTLVPIVLLAAALAWTPAGCRRTPPPEPASAVPEDAAGPPNTVRLTPAAVRAGGIVVEPARLTETARCLTGVGELQFNSRRLVHLTSRTSGRLEKVSAFRGDRVRAGQALAEIHSRDYLARQAEVLQASEREARLRGTPDGPSARSFLDAARANLLPFGESEAAVEALISTREVRPVLVVRAPFAGRIIEQTAVAGDPVEPGTELFQLADLGRLWAAVRIYEKDLGQVKAGVEAILRTEAFPGEEFRGRLALLGAVVNSATRTVEARVEVENPAEKLKPGMYVEAAIACGGTRRALVIPENALQELSSRPVVFLQTAPGVYELRLVEPGERTGGQVEVRNGLAEGDQVVTSGSFILKSELLKGSLGE